MEGHCIMKTVWFYQKRLKKQAFVTFKLCFGKWSYVSWCALSVARNRLCPVSRFQLVQLRRTISVTRAGVRTVDLFFGRILKSMPLKSARLPHARSNDALLAWASPQVTSLVQMNLVSCLRSGRSYEVFGFPNWHASCIWVSISRSKWVGEPD